MGERDEVPEPLDGMPSRLPEAGPCAYLYCPRCGGASVSCLGRVIDAVQLVCEVCGYGSLVEERDLDEWR